MVSLLVRACYQQATARGPKKMSSERKTRGEAERSLLEVSQCTRRKHEVALGLPLRADALALRPRGARSSPSRHQPVCLGDFGADLLICCHCAVTDGISADARPEKHDGRVDQAPAWRARRLVRSGRSAIESPCHRRRSGGRRRRTRGAARANVFCFLRLSKRSSWRRSPPL